MHPFYTDDGWIDAGDLEPGDLILALDGDYGEVESVVIVAEMQTMYDLDVETVDTFAVGDGEWEKKLMTSPLLNHSLHNLHNLEIGTLKSLLVGGRKKQNRIRTCFTACEPVKGVK